MDFSSVGTALFGGIAAEPLPGCSVLVFAAALAGGALRADRYFRLYFLVFQIAENPGLYVVRGSAGGIGMYLAMCSG